MSTYNKRIIVKGANCNMNSTKILSDGKIKHTIEKLNQNKDDEVE